MKAQHGGRRRTAVASPYAHTGSQSTLIPVRQRRHIGLRDKFAPYLFVAPFLFSFVIFFLGPSAFSLGLSFFRYSGYGDAQWVGVRNYSSLLDSPSFWQSVNNTVFYWLVPMIPLLGGAFLLALFVRAKMSRWPTIYKPLLFIPQIMAPVAAALVWRVILSDRGLLNTVFGLNVNWIADPAANKWGVAFLLIWRGIGWYFVIFLAGLTGVPEDLEEAAELDGANFVQRVRFLYIPLLRPIFLFAIVIDTISSLQLFTEPNLLIGGAQMLAPPSAAPIMNQVITNINGGQFGLAAAVGWLMFVTIGAFSLIQFRLLREDRS
jgi:ABC-type sugar transport system permease subunit